MKLFSIDTETTGLNPENGEALLEVGIVYFDDSKDIYQEMKVFHSYVFPGEDIKGNIYALGMNKDILPILVAYNERKKEFLKLANENKRNEANDLIVDISNENPFHWTKLVKINELAPSNTLLYEQHKLGRFLYEDQWVTVIEKEFINEAISEFHKKICNERSMNVIGKNFAAFDVRWFKVLPNFDKIHYKHRIGDVSNVYSTQEDKAFPNLQECMKRSELYKNNPVVPHTSVDDAKIVANLWIEYIHKKAKLFS